MWTKLVLATLVLSSGVACTNDPIQSPVGPSPGREVSPSVQQASVPRCDREIPFEPTYLPKGFGQVAIEGPFPGGRPPDDQSSADGKPRREQVIVHYRSSDSRAVEIRRPGTRFSELAQGDDAPTIEVLGMETSGFGPIEPGGDDFIVAFAYPPGTGTPKPCSYYTLNEYGVSLKQLKKVATSLTPADRCRTYPPPFEATYLPDGFSHELRPSAGLFKGTSYPTEGLLGHYVGRHETIHINFQVKGGPLPYLPGNPVPLTVLSRPATIGGIEGGYAVTFTNGPCDFRMDTYGISREETLEVAGGLREE